MRAPVLVPMLAAALLLGPVPGLAPIGTALAGERDCHYDRRGRHCRERGLSAGEAVLGAAALAGVVALLASDNQRDERIGGWDRGDEAARLEAIDACVEVAEREAGQFGRSSRVSRIDQVERLGERLEVRGAIEVDTRGGWDDGPHRNLGRADGDKVAFICLAGRGRVTDFRWDQGEEYLAL